VSGVRTERREREDRRSPKGAVCPSLYDGIWDQLWESRDDSHRFTFDQNGVLIVATGNERIYRLGAIKSGPRWSRASAGGDGLLQGRARPAMLDREPGRSLRLSPSARLAAT
jgi:hypothetical protein